MAKSEAVTLTLDGHEVKISNPGKIFFITGYLGDKIESWAREQYPDVELVFDPPWNQSMMSEAARLETGMF